MTDEIDKRIAIDRLVAQARKVAAKFGVSPDRDDIALMRAILEDMLPDGRGGSPGEVRRVESELIDYEPIPPYHVYIVDRRVPLTLRDYGRAQDLGRTESGARSVAVFIRDAADVITWEIRLTDEPLGQ